MNHSFQIIQRVYYPTTLNCLHQYGITLLIEMGPKKLLQTFTENMFDADTIHTLCFGIQKDKEYMINHATDIFVQKDRINYFGKCLSIIASTPNNNCTSDLADKVSLNYKAIKTMYLDSISKKVTDCDQMREEALKRLIDTLKIKDIDNNGQRELINELCNETGIF